MHIAQPQVYCGHTGMTNIVLLEPLSFFSLSIFIYASIKALGEKMNLSIKKSYPCWMSVEFINHLCQLHFAKYIALFLTFWHATCHSCLINSTGRRGGGWHSAWIAIAHRLVHFFSRCFKHKSYKINQCLACWYDQDIWRFVLLYNGCPWY